MVANIGEFQRFDLEERHPRIINRITIPWETHAAFTAQIEIALSIEELLTSKIPRELNRNEQKVWDLLVQIATRAKSSMKYLESLDDFPELPEVIDFAKLRAKISLAQELIKILKPKLYQHNTAERTIWEIAYEIAEETENTYDEVSAAYADRVRDLTEFL